MEKNLELTIRMVWGPFFIILLTIKMLCGIIQT